MQEITVQKKKKPPDSTRSPKTKITILYNQVNELSSGEPDDILADEDSVKTAQEIYRALKNESLQVEIFKITEKNFTDLLTYKTDIFINLCYGIGSIAKTEHEIPNLLDKIGASYTGANGLGIELTTDKVATKKIFLNKKIPTPYYQVFMSENDLLQKHMKFPLFVKPQLEDCSLGVHNDSVVQNEKELYRKVSQLFKKYHEPILVEQFINTRELNVTIVGNGNDLRILPISEIVFGKSFDNDKKWKIVDFDAKWMEQSSSYLDTIGICPAVLDEEIEKKIKKFAVDAYKACGCRDYARIDIRLDEENIPYFLEINANPGIGPQDGAVRSAKAAGYTYATFMKEIVRISLNRYKKALA